MREVGGQEWNRTTDTRIFNPLLYRLSYLAIAFGVYFLQMTRSKERVHLTALGRLSQ